MSTIAKQKLGEARLRWVILPLLLAVPFSYHSISDVRVLPLLLGVSLLAVLLKGIRYRNTFAIEGYALLMVYCFVFSMTSLAWDVFFSMLFFGWLVYWPIFLARKAVCRINVHRIHRLLINSGIALSIGLMVQIFLFRNYGLEIGKIDLIGTREAFGFIWSDYSFLSLFFASLIPLCWRESNRVLKKLAYTAAFSFASIMTSARAGIVALMVAYGLYFLAKTLRIFLTLRVRKIEAAYLVVGLISAPVLIFYIFELFPRISSIDDSGRLEGYASALGFSANNLILGARFDVMGYRDVLGAIPHNLFIYLLTVGGLLFLILFLIWIGALLIQIFRKSDKNVSLSIFISLIGFQFIPAFFSAYYFAFLLSLCIVLREQKNKVAESDVFVN